MERYAFDLTGFAFSHFVMRELHQIGQALALETPPKLDIRCVGVARPPPGLDRAEPSVMWRHRLRRAGDASSSAEAAEAPY